MRVLIAILAFVGLGLLFRKRLSAGAAALRAGLSERWQASEFRARRHVLRAIGNRDLNVTYAALDRWKQHHPGAAGPSDPLVEALAGIGRATHGYDGRPDGQQAGWAAAARYYRRLRRKLRQGERKASAGRLPPLNPF